MHGNETRMLPTDVNGDRDVVEHVSDMIFAQRELGAQALSRDTVCTTGLKTGTGTSDSRLHHAQGSIPK